MLKPNADGARTIPLGILVKQPAKVRVVERPVPRRKMTSSGQPLPWLWIATGGSVAWVAIMLVVALFTVSPEQRRAEGPPPLPFGQVAVEAPAPKPAVAAAVPDPDIAAEPAAQPKPLAKLPVWIDEAPPLIDIGPLAIEQPGAPAALAGRKDIDRNLYANCAQIGTNLLFMKDPPAAFKKARDEKKLVFVVHLSGLFEDKDFT